MLEREASARTFISRAVLVVAAVLACAEATGPTFRSVEGRYALTSIGGQPLPVVFRALNTPGRRLFVWADTFTFAGGTMRQDYVYRDSIPQDGTATEMRGTATSSYQQRADTVLIATSATRTDTAFVTAVGVRFALVDPALTFCAVPACEYIARRIP